MPRLSAEASPVLLVVPTDGAGRADDRRRTILPRQRRWASRVVDADRAVLPFPSQEVDPYRGLLPHLEVASARAGALHGLATGTARLVVASARALLPRLSEPGRFVAAGVSLLPGQEIAPRDLGERLVVAGFSPDDPVDEHGEYCVRGGIVDFYPASDAQPVRLEFVGDIIESIRRFDAATQRSMTALDRVTVTPQRELLPDASERRTIPAPSIGRRRSSTTSAGRRRARRVRARRRRGAGAGAGAAMAPDRRRSDEARTRGAAVRLDRGRLAGHQRLDRARPADQRTRGRGRRHPGPEPSRGAEAATGGGGEGGAGEGGPHRIAAGGGVPRPHRRLGRGDSGGAARRRSHRVRGRHAGPGGTHDRTAGGLRRPGQVGRPDRTIWKARRSSSRPAGCPRGSTCRPRTCGCSPRPTCSRRSAAPTSGADRPAAASCPTSGI